MQNNNQSGKGDIPRPVKKSIYNKNYDIINWGDKPDKKSKLKSIKLKPAGFSSEPY